MVIYNREEKVVIIPEGDGTIVGGRRNPCEKAINEAYQSGWTEGYNSGITADCGEAIEEAYESGITEGIEIGKESVLPYRIGIYVTTSGSVRVFSYDNPTVNGTEARFDIGEGQGSTGNIIGGLIYTNQSAITSFSFDCWTQTDDFPTEFETMFFSDPTLVDVRVLKGITAQSVTLVRHIGDVYVYRVEVEISGNFLIDNKAYYYNQGQIKGCQDCYQTGYDNGFSEGRTSGFTDGFASGWTSATTGGFVVFKLKKKETIAAWNGDPRDILVNGKQSECLGFDMNYQGGPSYIAISAKTTDTSIQSFEFKIDTSPSYVDSWDGAAINGFDATIVSQTTERTALDPETHSGYYATYHYTFTFDNEPIYQKFSYDAGFTDGYRYGTVREADILLGYVSDGFYLTNCRSLKINDETINYVENSLQNFNTIVCRTDITPITKIEAEIKYSGFNAASCPNIDSLTINGLPATIISVTKDAQASGLDIWCKYTINISSFIFSEYNEGYQAGLAACQNNENQ